LKKGIEELMKKEEEKEKHNANANEDANDGYWLPSFYCQRLIL
jgi:hypothetical protein